VIDTRLITFLTLLEEKSYTKTAKKLYISQPAVTQHIKSLEHDNNITLFKNAKTFELTQAGVVLKEYANIARQQYQQFENALSKQNNKVTSTVGITSMALVALYNNPSFINCVNSLKVKLNISCYPADEISDMLARGMLDFAIIDTSFDASKLDSSNISQEKIIACVKTDGIYKDEDAITKEMLNSLTLVTANSESGLYRVTMNMLRMKNIMLKSNTILESNSFSWMIHQVLLYDGVIICYKNALKEYIDKGILKEINFFDFNASQNFYLVHSNTSFLDSDILNIMNKVEKFNEV